MEMDQTKLIFNKNFFGTQYIQNLIYSLYSMIDINKTMLKFHLNSNPLLKMI